MTTMNLEKDDETVIRECALDAANLPLEVREVLYDFKTKGNRQGCLLFENLSVESSKYWLATYGSLLGEPYSYVQEGNGLLYHDVTPYKAYERELSSKSSKMNLDFHTELVFHHFIPDYLLLFCIRGCRDQEAKTYISSITHSLSEVSNDLRRLLEQPLFRTGIDVSFGNTNTIKGNGKVVPILYGDPKNPFLNFDPDMMEPTTEQARQAIHELRALLWKNKSTYVLQPGQLLIVDNKRAVHGRSSFTAYYDGQDRFLQRLFITKDLSRAQEIFSKRERIITY